VLNSSPEIWDIVIYQSKSVLQSSRKLQIKSCLPAISRAVVFTLGSMISTKVEMNMQTQKWVWCQLLWRGRRVYQNKICCCIFFVLVTLVIESGRHFFPWQRVAMIFHAYMCVKNTLLCIKNHTCISWFLYLAHSEISQVYCPTTSSNYSTLSQKLFYVLVYSICK
jgi:hypothetical protein